MRRTLILVTALTALSQLSAFFKLWLTARHFGVGQEIDGYNIALVAPTFIASVISGILQTGIFPTRAALAINATSHDVEQFERQVLWTFSGIGLFLSAAVFFCIEPAKGLLIPTSSLQTQAAFAQTLVICAILIPINIANDCTGYILAFRNRYAIAAGAPIINGLIGGAAIVLWEGSGIDGLIYGTLAGTVAQLTVCILGLKVLKFQFFEHWHFKQSIESFKSVLKAGGWILPGIIFSNITTSLPPVWAATFGEGAASAFNYAYKLHTSAVQLLIMASSTIILARLSELHAKRNYASISHILKQATYLSVAIGAIAIIGTWAFGETTLRFIFDGKFDSTAAQRVNTIWIFLSTGLGFTLLGNVISKLWQAQQRSKLMSAMAAISLALTIIIQQASKPTLGELSIPIALSSTSLIFLLIAKYLIKDCNPAKKS